MAKLKTAGAAAAEEAAKKTSASPFDFATDGDTNEGFEQVTNKTMAVPWLKILQKLSPQLDKQKPEYIEGAEEGEWFNTVTKDRFASIDVIAVRFENLYSEFKPNRGGFVTNHSEENAARLARASNTINDFGKWKTKEGNLLVEGYVYMLVLDGHETEGPVVTVFSSSFIKAAKEWNRIMATQVVKTEHGAIKPPWWYMIWTLSTEPAKNDKGSWYKPKVTFKDYIDKEQHAALAVERKALPGRTIDYTQLDTVVGGTDPAEAEAGAPPY